MAGERELVTSRFFAALPNRIFLPAGSTEEARLTWPRLRPPELMLKQGCRFWADVRHTVSFRQRRPAVRAPPPDVRRPRATVRARPFRVEALPVQVAAAEVLLRTRPGGAGPGGPAVPRPSTSTTETLPLPRRLLLGVTGDELLPAEVHVPNAGVLAVFGGPTSGKTTLLSALPGLNPQQGFIRPCGGERSGAFLGRNP
ncbi:hypothetical protein ACOM2C_06845 [Pseudarthrobacter sp. So.54]